MGNLSNKKKKLNVLIISRGYPTSKYPMNGIFEFDQAKALAKFGHDVVFAVIDIRSIRRWRKWGIEKFEKDGVKVYAINYPIGNVPLKFLLYFYEKGLKQLFKRVKNDIGNPDIMHAHFTRIGYAATKLKETTGIPLVITEHFSGLMNDSIESAVLDLGNKTYHKADKIITVSPALNKVLEEKFNVDSVYIPNIIDTDSFIYSETEKYDDFTFISVGSLIFRKRMDLIIEAFANLSNEFNNLKLIIIGEGPEKPKLEDLIGKYNLSSKINLTGRLERNKIAEYMSRSHCFVLPSRAETFGVVYIEAMLMGLPVIATRCGGPEGFVNIENGILVDIDEENDLVNAMTHMKNAQFQYNRKCISKSIIEKFSNEVVGKQIEDVYKDVIY